MNLNRTATILLASALGAGSALAQPATMAAAPPLTRQEVKMDRDAFLATHTWDEMNDVWTLKPGVEPPTGVKTRMAVKAERDAFLSRHHWDESLGNWVPEQAAPRDMAQMSREQVRTETAAFTRTHRWDEQSETWMLRETPRRR